MSQTSAVSLNTPSNNDNSTKAELPGSSTSRSPPSEKEGQPANSTSGSPPNEVVNVPDPVDTEAGRASETPVGPAPEGGAKAWLQVFGAFFLNMNSWCVGRLAQLIGVLTSSIGESSIHLVCIKHTT